MSQEIYVHLIFQVGVNKLTSGDMAGKTPAIATSPTSLEDGTANAAGPIIPNLTIMRF